MAETPIARSTLLTHFDYTLWASSKLLDAAGRLNPEELARDMQVSHTSILGTLQHIYYADRRIYYGFVVEWMRPARDQSLLAAGDYRGGDYYGGERG